MINVETYVGLMAALIVSVATGQEVADQVWLEPQRPTTTESDWYPRSIEHLTGKVVDFDARQLRLLVVGDEAESAIAAHRVIRIEPAEVSVEETEAMQLFSDRQYAQSLSKLPAVLKQRPPVWRQQWLTMLAAQAAWRSGRSEIALELVAQLDRRPLPPLILSKLPVAWQNGPQQADALVASQNRLNHSSQAVQLIAASWLLSSANRSQGLAVLKQLRTTGRPDIAPLAEILLWRSATPPQVIESNLTWERRIDRLPMVMQMGPLETLVNKLQSAGAVQRAQHLQWSMKMTNVQ